MKRDRAEDLRKDGIIPDIDEYHRCDYFASVHRVSTSIDKRPSETDYINNKESNYPTASELKEWADDGILNGEWSDVLRKTRLSHYSNGVDAFEILQYMNDYYKKAGNPTSGGYSDKARKNWNDYPSHSTIYPTLGSWNQFLYSMGYEINRGSPTIDDLRETQEEYIELLQKYYGDVEKNGHNHYKRNKKKGEPCWHKIVDLLGLGSFQIALKRAGVYTPQTSREGGSHNYGPNWDEIRSQVLENHGYTCQMCSVTEREHSRMFSCGLHVHHIVPFAEFESREKANQLFNLIPLCCACHGKLADGRGEISVEKQLKNGYLGIHEQHRRDNILELRDSVVDN